MKKFTLIVFSLFSIQAYAQTGSPNDGLKYFAIQGVTTPEMTKAIVENPVDLWTGAQEMVAGIKGAKLIDYYMEAGRARNLAIIAVPDSKYAAAVVYQRMGSLFMEDMTVFEIIPSTKFKEVLEIAKKLNESDPRSKK